MELVDDLVKEAAKEVTTTCIDLPCEHQCIVQFPCCARLSHVMQGQRTPSRAALGCHANNRQSRAHRSCASLF